MSDVVPISRTDLEEKIARGESFILLEALAPSSYEQAHLPGALNMPSDAVDELAPQLIPSKDTEVIVYCANLPCQGSTIAARRLTQLGYTNVREYEGGKQDWVEAGLTTESGPTAQVA